MHTTNKAFTVEVALVFQLTDIAKWSKILTKDAYTKLLNEALRRNALGYTSPYHVFRGQDITNFVINLTH